MWTSLDTVDLCLPIRAANLGQELPGDQPIGDDEAVLAYRIDGALPALSGESRRGELVVHQPLRTAVADGLSRRRAPEQISHRLREDYPDDESMRVSHETIYQALHFQARGGLKHEVAQALRTGSTRRKPRRAPGQRTHRFVDEMVMISDRPAEVADRAVPGNWESQCCCEAAVLVVPGGASMV